LPASPLGEELALFDLYAHYLIYGSTDQETVRSLRTSIGGLLVPGTIAAFQRAGTGGFVSSFSASQSTPPYSIDPRFPLFQQPLPQPKRSHFALAELLGDRELVSVLETPEPQAFPPDRIEALAAAWVRFNRGYPREGVKSFDKYAKRLGEAILPASAADPDPILSLYFVARGKEDAWWNISKQLYSAIKEHEPNAVRVVAVEDSHQLGPLLSDIDDERIAIWVSGMDELNRESTELTQYGATVQAASRRGQRLFSLYGGFFHVLLGGVGLAGAAHGIGFSESRQWRELPKSGPPPARYYYERIHRYVSQELMHRIYLEDPDLVKCDCAACRGRPPMALGYHELMRHSVYARNNEINCWAHLPPSEAAPVLTTNFQEMAERLNSLKLGPLASQAMKSLEHLPRWIETLTELSDS